MRVFTHPQVCKMAPRAALGQMIISCVNAFMGEKQGQHGRCRILVCEPLGFNGMLSAGLSPLQEQKAGRESVCMVKE